ncbi:MAG: hypothetical protein HY723_05320 [Chloroflexi bacterium]|nr:hypothetical protein [Chloroflexota bacterium]
MARGCAVDLLQQLETPPTPTRLPSTTTTPSRTPTNTASPTPSHTPTPTPAGLRGDATCDGVANSVDSLYILQFYAALLRALPCPQNADVNRDGVIDARDSLLILQLDAGLIRALPAGAAGVAWRSRLVAAW